MFQVPWSDMIRQEAGIATMCVGNITTADQANTILAAGRADLVALARPHLTDPMFALRAAAQYGVPTCPARCSTAGAATRLCGTRRRSGRSCATCG
jgi:anthraniloyl-CoA monooxygenase